MHTNKPLLTQSDKYKEKPARNLHLVPQSEFEVEKTLPHSQSQLLERRVLLDKGISLEKKMEKVRQAVVEKMRPALYNNSVAEAGPTSPYPNVKETRESHVIVERGGDTFAVPYSCSENGDVKVGKPKKIRPAYVEAD